MLPQTANHPTAELFLPSQAHTTRTTTHAPQRHNHQRAAEPAAPAKRFSAGRGLAVLTSMSENPNAEPPPAISTPHPAEQPPIPGGQVAYEELSDHYEMPPRGPADTLVVEREEPGSPTHAAFPAPWVSVGTRVLLPVLAACAGCVLTIILQRHPTTPTRPCQGAPARTPAAPRRHTARAAAHPSRHYLQPEDSPPSGCRGISPAHASARPRGHRGLTATSPDQRLPRRVRAPHRDAHTRRDTTSHPTTNTSRPTHLASPNAAAPSPPPAQPTLPSPPSQGSDEQVKGGPFSP